MGKDIGGDSLLFNDVDADQLNKAAAGNKKQGVGVCQALERWELMEVMERHFDMAVVPPVVLAHSLQL